MSRYVSLVPFLLLVVGGGLLIGAVTRPGAWYDGLAKPPFNPPGWVFGPVWTLLYVMIAVVGWRIWRRERGGWPMRLWWAQLALNFLWSPVFFAAHLPGLAFVVLLLMGATTVGFMATAWRNDRASSWLFLPISTGWASPPCSTA
jgi:tryptophan-rich sensory protein